MTFPLGDWIDDHEDCRFNLGESGMKGVVGPVRPSDRAVEQADPSALRSLLARAIDVAPDRLFLTHGATEGNALATSFVARTTRGTKVPRCRVLAPEYPPLADTARWAGFRLTDAPEASALTVLSNPRNPEGRWMEPSEVLGLARGSRHLLIDETFREFRPSPSFPGDARRGVWRTGTFTKFFGGDAIRVGFVAVPEEAGERFARFHRLFADPMPSYSVAAALATWARLPMIRRRVARVFDRNAALVKDIFPGQPRLAAPVFFDRLPDGRGRALAERCLRASVLVCPGDLFGDPAGVRIGLTRPTFPRDLDAYLRVRKATAGLAGSVRFDGSAVPPSE